MQELLYVAVAIVVIGGLLSVVAWKVDAVLARVEELLTMVSTAVIVLVMLFVCAEVFSRYILDSPIPGHLEGSELFVPVIVFFAISYTQAKNGHVGMTMIIDALPRKAQWALTLFTLAMSVFTCAVLTYFSFEFAYRSWSYDDVTMTPPYWPTWPAAAAIVMGYGMVSLRMLIQMVHLVRPEKFSYPTILDQEVHIPE